MGFFDKIATAVGIGGAKLDLVVEAGVYQAGAFATGRVVVKAGKSPQSCDGLTVEIRKWVEREEEVNGQTQKVQAKETLVRKELAPNGFRIEAGSETVLPFRIYLPTDGDLEVVASADIPGALDPSSSTRLKVGPGHQGFLPRSALERIDGTPGPREINRIGGKPIGVDAKSWPRHEGKALSHLVTVDLATLDLPFVPKNRALAVFCLDPDDNEAFEPNNPYTRVVLLSAQDIGKGEPAEVPEHAQLPAYRLETSALDGESRTYFGGAPKWIQGDPTRDAGDDFVQSMQKAMEMGGFYLQFDERLVPMNLGDAGVMYVFERTAFWQCH